MSRGGSAGGGQSQLGYLFGSGEAPKPAVAPTAPATSAPPTEKPTPAKPDVTKQIPAGVTSQTNNYHRADGQNTGNFLTVRWFPFHMKTFLVFIYHWLSSIYILSIVVVFKECWAGEYHVTNIMEAYVALSHDILVLVTH